MLIQYVIEELAAINKHISYMKILGCSEEQIREELQRREYLMEVIEQFEGVGV